MPHVFSVQARLSCKKTAQACADEADDHQNKERYAVYQKYEDFSYVGHTLAFKWKGFEIEQFEQQIREAFRFPELEADDMRNAKCLH